MAAPIPPVAAGGQEERLAFLMTPWVDRTIAIVAQNLGSEDPSYMPAGRRRCENPR